ncbi:MAG: DUF4139 domain-containing protein [Candidatus Riflebacteria bacterium]|nr:DUF4139 domain-containing protein [Candidatus Riflebacteria bacterium]
MAPPDSPSRGKLSPAAEDDLGLELLKAMNVSLAFDLQAVVQGAAWEATNVAAGPPPPGSVWVGDQDRHDHAFTAQARVDVPSDGHCHTVTLLTQESPTRIRHVVVPRESPHAFRVAAFPNPLDGPILPGPADVTVGCDHLLTTRFSSVPPGGDVELGLGVEQGVKVARNTRYGEQTTGLITGTLELAHEISIEVTNLLAVKTTVEVRERVPRPADEKEEIKVEVVRSDPPWERFVQPSPPTRSTYRWVVSVGPGEKKTLKASYSIHLAARLELEGGNRREAH